MPVTMDDEVRAWDKCEGGVRALNEGLVALLALPPPIVQSDEERLRVRKMADEMRVIGGLLDKLADQK